MRIEMQQSPCLFPLTSRVEIILTCANPVGLGFIFYRRMSGCRKPAFGIHPEK